MVFIVYQIMKKKNIYAKKQINKCAFCLPIYLVGVLFLFAKLIAHDFSEQNTNNSVENMIKMFLI